VFEVKEMKSNSEGMEREDNLYMLHFHEEAKKRKWRDTSSETEHF